MGVQRQNLPFIGKSYDFSLRNAATFADVTHGYPACCRQPRSILKMFGTDISTHTQFLDAAPISSVNVYFIGVHYKEINMYDCWLLWNRFVNE